MDQSPLFNVAISNTKKPHYAKCHGYRDDHNCDAPRRHGRTITLMIEGR